MNIRHIVSKLCELIPGGIPFRTWWRDRRRILGVNKARKRLQKHGWEVLSHCIEMMKKAEIPCYVEYGTLLGLVREGRFIEHDDDIDFGIPPINVNSRLLYKFAIDAGLVFKRAFVWRGVLTEMAFEYKKVPVDFFYSFKDQDGRIYCQSYTDFSISGKHDIATAVTRLYKPDFTSIVLKECNGVQVPFVENPERLLEMNYGVSWRTPLDGVKADAREFNRVRYNDEALIVSSEDELRRYL